jgi:F420-0:gamma-glutamyl ligase-like protein
MEIQVNELTSTPSPNEGKRLIIEVDGKKYARYPLKTPVVTDQHDIIEIVNEAVESHLSGDAVVVITEKIVAISQGRAFPVDQIKPSFWARFISKFVSKHSWGIGIGMPETMELAIREAGLWRILAAGLIAFPLRLVGVKGLFYVLVGKNVNAIDGPTPYTLPPYNRYAKLPPKDPEKVAQQISAALSGAKVVIIDANDFGQRILGASSGVDRGLVRSTFADNPLGQESQQTPIAIVKQVD